MNKKINYKVMAAFSSFVLAVASLVTVTVAWYEFSNALQVDNLSYTIYDDEGVLQLGLKAPASSFSSLKEKYSDETGEWVDDIYYFTDNEFHITTDVLTDFGQYDEGTKLQPISNAYYNEWFDNASSLDTTRPIYTKMPTLHDIGGKTIVTREEQKDFYYEFEFYIRATNVPVFVFLSSNITILPDTVKNAEKAAVSSNTEESLNKVSNYIRVGFFSELDYTDDDGNRTNKFTYNVFDGNPTYEDSVLQKTKYYGRLDADPQDGYYDVYPSIDDGASEYRKNEILYGRYSLLNGANLVYSENARATGLEKHELVGGFFANSWGNANPVDVEQSKVINGENLILYEENALDKKRTTSSSTNAYKRIENALTYVKRNEAKKLIVTMWAEGWDLDCGKDSSDASFIANIILNGRDVNSQDEWGH